MGLSQTEFFADPDIKGFCPAGLGIGFGANAEHGHHVFDAGKAVQRLATHALGGGIGREQFRVGRFERLQFFEQAVVFRVGDGGCVQHVVLVAVVMQLFAQSRGTDGNVLGRCAQAA